MLERAHLVRKLLQLRDLVNDDPPEFFFGELPLVVLDELFELDVHLVFLEQVALEALQVDASLCLCLHL